MVSLLFHNDYVSAASFILEEEGHIILKNFEQLDIKDLRVPRYNNLIDDDRLVKLQEICASQFQQTICFLRKPMELAIARDFALKG